jgi:hypothetical protein
VHIGSEDDHQEMVPKVLNMKRRLINPDDLLSDDTCLVISSDASDEGCGASLACIDIDIVDSVVVVITVYSIRL